MNEKNGDRLKLRRINTILLLLMLLSLIFDTSTIIGQIKNYQYL